MLPLTSARGIILETEGDHSTVVIVPTFLECTKLSVGLRESFSREMFYSAQNARHLGDKARGQG